MRLADSHNHIHFPECRPDLLAIIDRARKAGVAAMLLVGTDPDDSRKAITIAQQYTGLSATIGIHPQLAGKYTPEGVHNLAGLAGPKVVAVGETGFDLYRTPDTPAQQRELFRAHIELARQLRLPLIIHDRAAHAQTLAVLDEMDGWSLGGVMHCFSGDTDMARAVLDKGFFLSIPGVITYKNAAILAAVARHTPSECLLIETDAPYLSPAPYRGKRNEPAYLVETIRALAAIKKVGLDEIAQMTYENFSRLFLAKRA